MSTKPIALSGVEVDQTAAIQRCKACHAEIWFGRTKAGRVCPFDVQAGERTTVTHFSTCSRVRQFEKPRAAR